MPVWPSVRCHQDRQHHVVRRSSDGRKPSPATPSPRISLQTGTDTGTVTVAAGAAVSQIQAHSTSGGTTITITLAGAAAALSVITVPASANWFVMDFDPARLEIVAGATIAFASGVDAYVVRQTLMGGL